MSEQEIVVFFTGGTIGMTAAENSAGVAPGNNSGRVFAGIAQSGAAARITPVAWADLPSPHVGPPVMLALARELDARLSCPQTAGAVVLHGTDLMAETAFFLDVALASRKPVLVTGSMRSLGEPGYDGLRNLADGLALCGAAAEGHGVLVLMAGLAFAAGDALKVDSTSPQPLRSQNLGPLARVVDGQGIFYHGPGRSGPAAQLLQRPLPGLADRVEVLKCWPGMNADCLDFWLERGLAGLVLEGFGAGNAPPQILPGLKKILARGIPTVLTTRCPHGGVQPLYAYPGGGVNLLELGALNGYNLTADKAALLLQIALGQNLGRDALAALCAWYGYGTSDAAPRS